MINIVFNHPLPKILRKGGITLGSYILVAETEENTPEYMIRHELIHVRQIREKGLVWFYLTYLFWFVVKFIQLRSWQEAYKAIPYEVEAYALQDTETSTEELVKRSV